MFNFVFLNETNLYYIFKFVGISNLILYNENYHVNKDDIIIYNFWNFKNNLEKISSNNSDVVSNIWNFEHIFSKFINLNTDKESELSFLKKIVDYFPHNKIIVDSLPQERGFNFKFEYDKVLYLFGNYENSKIKNQITCGCFWWVQEYIWNKDNLNKNFDLLKNRKFNKKFLMPLRNPWHHRKILLKELENFLDDATYSAVWLGINLPNDCDNSFFANDRYFNYEWYDTYFSVVAESWHRPFGSIFITEKTIKPIQYLHPFLILSQKHHLKLLKEFNFTTFDNIFDETYDEITNLNEKIKIIKQNIENFNYCDSYDNLTVEKLKHNYFNFTNEKFILEKIKSELIFNIENFINFQ